MSDILKVAEEAWGGLWVVDAEDLPQFEDEEMEPITAYGIRRVVGQELAGRMNPIVALIPKYGAENEGQLRPISILSYIYRVWMAVRKRSETVGDAAS
eukprot:11522083-Heterocapsa_arctica.AAC.1